MRRSRLFHSIVVCGASAGAVYGTVIAVSAAMSGCALYFEPSKGGKPGTWSTIADAPNDSWYGCGDFDGGYCVDVHWGIIDAPLPPDGWGTIADAPNDAGTSG